MTITAMSPEDAAIVQDLALHARMADVQYYELTGEVIVKPEEDGGDLLETDDPLPLNVNLVPQFRRDDDSFGFRIVATVSSRVARFRVVVAGEFEVSEGYELPDVRLLKLFGNEYGLIQVFPYVRSALNDLSLRILDTSMTLPHIHPGILEFKEARRSS